MIQWTTPNITIIFQEGTLTNYKQIAVSIKQNDKVWTSIDPIVDGDTITVSLSQFNSSKFVGKAKLQVNVLYENGMRAATKIFDVHFSDNILDTEMEI